MHKTASVAEWYKNHGRHPVYAKRKRVPGIQKAKSIVLPVINKIPTEQEKISPYLIDEDSISMPFQDRMLV
jgi:hypothetical protein